MLLCAVLVCFASAHCFGAEAQASPSGNVHCVSLPIDHSDLSKGEFWGYYVVGFNQSLSQPPVFFLADGQMNMIRPKKECSEFQEWFGGAPFILPCVRGFSPEVLDKCKRPDGTVNMDVARRVFASWQQVEDIEAIRQNLIREGILPGDGKISVYGASGGGILAQEYVTRYPDAVHKLILETTGSHALARRNNITLIRNLADYDIHLAVECELLRQTGFRDFENLSYLLYNLGRLNENAVDRMTDLVHRINHGDRGLYENYLQNGIFNLASVTINLSTMKNIGCRIRLCEIWEAEIQRYQKRGRRPINLGYEWVSFCLSDLLRDHAANGISVPFYEFDLSRFHGETLVIAGTEDIVFSPDMARSFVKADNHSVLALLVDGHGMEKHWSLVCELRREFLEKPLTSVMTDAKFRSVRFEKGE